MQTVDHFGWATPPNNITTFQQRYFVCDQYWKGDPAPIFFYTGNEADVELCKQLRVYICAFVHDAHN